jgi:hypothetical protein
MLLGWIFSANLEKCLGHDGFTGSLLTTAPLARVHIALDYFEGICYISN